jgi:hypothetical protein
MQEVAKSWIFMQEVALCDVCLSFMQEVVKSLMLYKLSDVCLSSCWSPVQFCWSPVKISYLLQVLTLDQVDRVLIRCSFVGHL